MTMTTLSNNEKSIDIRLTGAITIVNDNCYRVNLPTVSCSTENDALYMQRKINEFVNNLSRELLK